MVEATLCTRSWEPKIPFMGLVGECYIMNGEIRELPDFRDRLEDIELRRKGEKGVT